MSAFSMMTDRREALAIAAAATVPLALGTTALAASSAPSTASVPLPTGRDQPFDDGWRFWRGAGEGLEASGFDDSQWRSIDLPHDWSVEDLPGGTTGPFNKASRGRTATGYTEGGEGWYRKHFRIDNLPADARVEVLFDGIYGTSDIWLNGKPLGGNVHGYRAFALDLTPLLNAGDNVLAVRVRNLGRNSRWYSGSGIYRQVTLDITPATTRLTRWGAAAWTRKIDNGRAEIDVTTGIDNADPALRLITRLRDAKGVVVAEASSPASAAVQQSLLVKAPHLWSPASPYLHMLESELRRGDVVVDRVVQPFGIRIITMDARIGMAINGSTLKLRGGCIHHDNGLLGACAFADADERRIRLMKARGFNAIRSSHNPASRSLRHACDRLGMLLIEEAFDMWHSAKEPDDFSNHFKDHWQEVIASMVLSGRNSPSVIMWSIGNEIPYRATDEGVEWEWKLANEVRRLDPTRPVTAGLNGTLGAPMIADAATARAGQAGKADNASTIFLDVPGYNYRLNNIEAEHANHPERVVYASETFATEAYDYQALAARAPYFLGEFVWTAMDYIGEAGLGATANIRKGGAPFYIAAYPWVNAWCGDIDLIGRQKASSLNRDVVWGISPLEMTVHRPIPDDKQEFVAMWGWPDELQSWTWPGAEGKPLSVRITTSAQRVELLLNGQKIGEKLLTAADRQTARFDIAYQPGTLETVAYADGKIIARRRLDTAGPATRLRIAAEPASGHNSRQSLRYLPIEVLDARGRVLPDDMRKIALTIHGPADLIGFGSANPMAVGSLQQPEAQSFRGRALAILRSRGVPGTIRVEARSEGLTSASTIIKLG